MSPTTLKEEVLTLLLSAKLLIELDEIEAFHTSSVSGVDGNVKYIIALKY